MLDTARARRPSSRRDVELASGPARLAQALGVDESFLGVDMLDPDSPLRLLPAVGRRRRGAVRAARGWACRPPRTCRGGSGWTAIRP